MGRDQLNLISSHSLRVTACVLLHEAGKDGTYIKLRLRWLSNCFEIYLRNSDIIMAQHESALAPFHERVKHFALDLVGLFEPEDDPAGTPDNAAFPMDDAEDIDLESVYVSTLDYYNVLICGLLCVHCLKHCPPLLNMVVQSLQNPLILCLMSILI